VPFNSPQLLVAVVFPHQTDNSLGILSTLLAGCPGSQKFTFKSNKQNYPYTRTDSGSQKIHLALKLN
jgi:hypothetical protein